MMLLRVFFLAVGMVWGGVVCEAGPAEKKAPNVRDLFNDALKLQQEDRRQAAMEAYEKLLKIFPGHQPSLIQYAHLLYSVDRIPEAQQIYGRVDPVGLDAAASYEYALAHFWMRFYDRALFGFKRVPEGHALYDLANYYGAISALKLRRLIEAEVMMERAVVLPEKLVRSRDIYRRHIQDLKLMYEKKGLGEEKERERKRIDATVGREEANKLSPEQTELFIRKYHHRGLQTVEIAPVAGIDYKLQQIDKHGYAQEDAQIRTSYFRFRGGPLLALPWRIGRDQSAVGLQLEGQVEEMYRTGIEKRNFVSDDVDDIQRIETTNTQKKVVRSGTLSANPWIEIPTPGRLWFGLGGKIAYKYPDFQTVARSGQLISYAQLGARRGLAIYQSTYRYGEILDQRNEHTSRFHEGSLRALIPVISSLTTDASLTHQMFLYDVEDLDGPSSVSTLKIDTFYQLPLGLGLGVAAAGQYLKESVFHNIPSFDQVSADGETFSGKGYFSINPWRWLFLTISQEVQKTSWHVTPDIAEESFSQNTPDLQQTFRATLELDLLF